MRKKIIYLFLAASSLFVVGCEKTDIQKQSSREEKQIEEVSDATRKQEEDPNAMRVPPSCTSFSALNFTSPNLLKGTYGGITIYVQSPIYESCSGSSTPINGMPFYGGLGVNYGENTTVFLYPTDPTVGNQFVIAQGTFSTGGESTLQQYVNKYKTALFTWQNNPTTLPPNVADYIKPVTGIRIITGKLIRVTTGSNFAVAPTCFQDRQCLGVE